MTLLSLMALCAVAAAPSDPQPRHEQIGLIERVKRLDMVFGTHGNVPAEIDPDTFRTFLGTRTSQAAFYQTLIPKLFAGTRVAYNNHKYWYPLNTDTTNGRSVLYLKKPCPASEQVEVSPWWDRDTKVFICEDSYRPALKRSTDTDQYCEAPTQLRSRDRTCGCGEFLLNCTRDKAMSADIQKASSEEWERTLELVLRERMPFSRVLSIPETVRSDLGDYYYLRDQFFRTGKWNLPKFATANRALSLRPRPAERVGVLTTPYWIYQNNGIRLVVADTWDHFLCAPLDSRQVQSKDILQLESSQLVSEAFPHLTQMTGCKECHSKLENGMRALSGFLSLRKGARFDPSMKYQGTAKFFVRDSSDLRGEGPATVEWLGQMLASQPEFYDCMVKKGEELIYAGAEVPAGVHKHLLREFKDGQDLLKVIEDSAFAWTFGESSFLEEAARSKRKVAR